MMQVIPLLGMTQKYYPLDIILFFLNTTFLRKAELKFYNFIETHVKQRLRLQTPRPDL
jgi:hypothetical protein